MGSKKSFLEIVNKTNLSMSIKVDGTDSYDWEGNSRPDKNFMNVTIPPNSSRKEREELNSKARSAWFTIHITLSNGDKISFKNDQYDAFNPLRRYYTLDGSKNSEYMACQMNEEKDVNHFIIFPFSLKKWMSLLPDSTSLYNLSIPGTHESCALNNGISIIYAQCQNWDLATQLNNGVRYLDIRGEAKKDNKGDYITIKHGIVTQPYDLHKVLKDVKEFLRLNPKETVLLQLKQESSSLKGPQYATIVQSYIDHEEYKNIFYLHQCKVQLKDVRGKIVLVNRFVNTPDYGINLSKWPEDTTAEKSNGVITYSIQDVYKICKFTNEYMRDRKMDFINSFFQDYAFKRNQLNLCFCSAICFPLTTPKTFAYGINGINARIFKQHLQATRKWNGVLLFDYIDSNHLNTIPYIINNNFKK